MIEFVKTNKSRSHARIDPNILDSVRTGIHVRDLLTLGQAVLRVQGHPVTDPQRDSNGKEIDS